MVKGTRAVLTGRRLFRHGGIREGSSRPPCGHLAHCSSVGDRWFSDYLHLQIAECAIRQGSLEEATTHADIALRSRVDFADRQGQAHAQLRLGDVAMARKMHADARERYLLALKLYREASDRGGQALSQASLAAVDIGDGDRASARGRYLRALELATAIGYAQALAEVALGVAKLQAEDGDASGAAMVLAFLQGWQNAPLAAREEAERVQAGLGLKQPAIADARRQAEGLTLAKLCQAIERVLHSAGAASVPLAPGESELTRRELQVLTLLDRGYTNNAVAKELGLTVSTVKWYCTNIFGKLGAANRTAALAKARTAGLLA